jgi:MATE family multidrug resistance protein
MYSYTGAYMFYPFFVYIFVYVYGYDVSGLGIARTLCEIMAYSALYIIISVWYMKKFRRQKSWFAYNMDALRDWSIFLRVLVPIGMATFMEFTFWEIQTFIIGTMQFADQLAAHTSYGTIEVLLFYIPLSLSYTINSYLGKLVGSG